jgi:hypothetical protein
MPQGIFLLVDDPIKGLLVEAEYHRTALQIDPQFYAHLYSSHAEYAQESILKANYENYTIISYAPKDIATQTMKAGVLGLVLDYHETLENVFLFLRRTLRPALKHPTSAWLKEVLEVKLHRYFLLNRIFSTIQIENISEILVIKGNNNYQSTLLRLGTKESSRLDLAVLYKRIVKGSKIPKVNYYRIKSALSNIYLIVKFSKAKEQIDKIFKMIQHYLDKDLNYALEILALVLLAPVIALASTNQSLYPGPSEKRSVLHVLHNSDDYGSEFNEVLSSLIRGETYLSSTLD